MDYKKLYEIIDDSNNIVFFGGAGVSTESGIPDFRSAKGIFNEKLNKNFSPEEIVSRFLELEGPIPKCKKCGAIVKPDVVLYEEGLDDNIINESIKLISSCDTLIIGGTSLVVYPAAGFIRYFRGKNLILINKSKTKFDSEADIVIHDSIGKVLSETIKQLIGND